MPEIQTSELITHLLLSVIDVIGRRSSERYAIVLIKEVIGDLEKQYKFFKNINIQTAQYSEIEDTVTVTSKIDKVAKQDLCDGLRELLARIVSSAGKTAGYFFIKELKETMKTTYVNAFSSMDLDLDYLQLRYVVKKETTEQLDTTKTGVIRRFISCLVEILREEYSLDMAIEIISDVLDEGSTPYPVLDYITIQDVRFTQGDESIWIAPDMNEINEEKIGKALEHILMSIHTYEERIITSLQEKLVLRLSKKDYSLLEKWGVNFSLLVVNNTELLKHVLVVILKVLSRSKTPKYATSLLETIIVKVVPRFEFLKAVSIDTKKKTILDDSVVITGELQGVTKSETGRAIQKIMDELIKELKGDLHEHFLDEFKKRMTKTQLRQLEYELGVNLYIIQLRQELTNPKELEAL